MPDVMRVLFVLSKATTGGTATLAAGWASALGLFGAAVDIVVLASSDEHNVAPQLQPFVPIKGLGHSGWSTQWSTHRQLRAHIRHGAYDIVHGFLRPADRHVSFASVGQRVIRVGTVVSKGSPAFYGPQPHLWISVGETAAEHAAVRRSKTRIVYPAMSFRPSKEKRDDLRTHFPESWRKTKIVIGVGRLVAGKGFDTLIRAMGMLPPEFRLAIVGTGPDRRELTELVTVLGLQERVAFLGKRADIPELLGGADVYAAATLQEGIVGFATLEAVASRLPVVVSDLPEIREVFDGQDLFFATPRSPGSFAARIAEAALGIEEDQLRVSISKVGEFSPESVGQLLLSEYQNAKRSMFA